MQVTTCQHQVFEFAPAYKCNKCRRSTIGCRRITTFIHGSARLCGRRPVAARPLFAARSREDFLPSPTARNFRELQFKLLHFTFVELQTLRFQFACRIEFRSELLTTDRSWKKDRTFPTTVSWSVAVYFVLRTFLLISRMFTCDRHL